MSIWGNEAPGANGTNNDIRAVASIRSSRIGI
jgi:hypothetical protein